MKNQIVLQNHQVYVKLTKYYLIIKYLQCVLFLNITIPLIFACPNEKKNQLCLTIMLCRTKLKC